MVEAEIRAYYERNDERGRLASGGRRIEFLRVRELLERYLPAPPATVLDVGGAAGRYAIPLAAAGYRVHLIDPVPLLVSQAAAAAEAADVSLASVSVGDARSLTMAGASVDATLLLGPLYHLTSRDDRIAALAEARRVTRPGGVVVAVGLSRFYPLFEELAARAPGWHAGAAARFLADGQYRNPAGDTDGFTTSYFHRPEDLAAEVTDAGLRLDALVGANGIVKLLLPDLSQRLDDDARRESVTGLLRLVEAEPSLLGLSQNLVAIATAPWTESAGAQQPIGPVDGVQGVAVAEAKGGGTGGQPGLGHRERELHPEHGLEVGPGGELPAAAHRGPVGAAGRPPGVGGCSPGWHERTFRGPDQSGEVTGRQVVPDDDERATRPQHPHHLHEPRVADRREKVGEARVHHVDGLGRQRDVLG
jgi:ubiquinone/menaquinone biosynthesis C-methylase UbiE